MSFLKRIFGRSKNPDKSRKRAERELVKEKSVAAKDLAEGLSDAGKLMKVMVEMNIDPTSIPVKNDSDLFLEISEAVERKGKDLSDIIKIWDGHGYNIETLINFFVSGGITEMKMAEATEKAGLAINFVKYNEILTKIENEHKKGNFDNVINMATGAIDSGEIRFQLGSFYDLRAQAYRDKGLLSLALRDTEKALELAEEGLEHLKDPLAIVEDWKTNLKSPKKEVKRISFETLTDNQKRELLDAGVYLQICLSFRENGTKPITFGELPSGHEIINQLSEKDLSFLIKVRDLESKASDLGNSGDHQKAIEVFEEVLELAPWNSVAMMSLGVQYALLKKERLALELLEKASRMDPSNEQIKQNLTAVKRDFGYLT